MTSVLFDESHGQLLNSQADASDHEVDTWNLLSKEIASMEWNVALYQAGDGFLTKEVLAEYDVLVLAAFTKPLNLAEIDAVTNFVFEGKSLLIANNAESFWRQENNTTNVLLESFGLRIERLLSYPPDEVVTIHPHYITSEVEKLVIVEPVYLETVNAKPRVLATLPWTGKPFLTAVEVMPGRVVAVGDFVIFGDRYIDTAHNRQLVSNILRWLAFENTLDCSDVCMDAEVRYGHTATFSITLSNPHANKLERIRCLLESDAGAIIGDSTLRIRSIPGGGQTWLQWTIEPQQLGHQNLRLTVDFPKKMRQPSLFFNPVAQFECLPDASIDLVILNQQGETIETIETGTSFWVKAVTRWANEATELPLCFELEYSLSHFEVETTKQSSANRWLLTALDAGDWPITLAVDNTSRRITRLLRVRPSTSARISAIDRDTVVPLAAEIHHQVSQIRPEFDTDAIRRIPFHLLTPEEHVRLLYPPDVAKHFLQALQSARNETHTNEPLVKDLLSNVAPTYSPVHGCCVPYDPELVAHLAKEHACYEEDLAHNFLHMVGYDQVWLDQNIAAFLLHEKYGHGFFFTQTMLGQQLAILYRHGMIRRLDSERLQTPYPRLLYEEYEPAIQALYDSSIIVNEGLAAWIELTILPRLSGAVGQAAYRRRDALFNRNEELRRAKTRSPYFQCFPPFANSQYQEGCDYLRLIQGYFGEDWGPKCAIQAVIKASEVSVGISENGEQVQFGLSAQALADSILNAQSDDARADMRLRHIHSVLRKYIDRIWAKQRRLQCHRVCLHPECPVNAIIGEKLGW
jgi:hypothetical protein